METDAHDGFVTYDELKGPDLDAARWSPARLPLPTGDEHIALDPNAELTVGGSEVRVMIPRFSLSHDRFQAADSAKYLILSKREFELPPEDFTRLRACEITLDRSTSSAAWRVDGHVVHQTQGSFIPERVGIGFGIWTMLPIRAGRSRSLDGQGMTARWHRFRLRGVDA
jgi:hypothetical protein